MSKKHFTQEQIYALKESPWVERVSHLSVSFTEDFKRKAYGELLSGKPIWQIFQDHGIDTEALGPVRVLKFTQFLQMCAKRDDGFKNMRNVWRMRKGHISEESAEKRRVKSLENENAYLRQVVEFLKKIQEAESGARK
jgi:hypothetical protein